MVDLRPDQLATVQTILKAEVPAAEVWVFGSRAKWTAKDTSDLDLAIIADNPIPLATMNRLRRAFDETHLPFQVDVVDWRRTEERFRSIIDQDHVVLLPPSKHSDGPARVRRVVSLADCVDFVSGGTPSKANPEYWNGRIPWVSAKDMKHFRITDSEDHVTEAALGNGARQVPSKTVLILVRGMTLHHDVPICLTETAVTFNQDVRGLRAKSHVDPEFLAYVLLAKKPMLRSFVDAASHGTGRIHSGILSSLPIELPELPEQQLISGFLRALDDKIELNGRMNETLEAIARALFKSWFVDFDPVRAKVEGRDPGLPAPIADLFPNHFTDSKLGEIPKGWQYFPLSDLVGLTRGTTYKSGLKGFPGPVLLGLASIQRNGGFKGDKLSTYGGASPAKLVLGPGELFVSLKDVTQSADLLGAVARVPEYIERGRLTQDTVKLTFKFATTSRQIVYRTLLTPEYRDYCRGHATGTTNLGLSRDDFLAFPVVGPNEGVQRAFDTLIENIEARAAAATAESRTLAALRDSLLPKLISGELRV